MQVLVLKNPADDLGMAILGGRDHNLPIIISEIFPDSALSRCNRWAGALSQDRMLSVYLFRIQAGDIICSVNDEDFTQKTHAEAVNFLSSLRGQIHFDLKSSEEVSEDDPSNLDYRFYKLFHPHLAPAAPPRAEAAPSPPSPSHPGKAVSVEAGPAEPRPEPVMQVQADLPSVHSSPKKGEIHIV